MIKIEISAHYGPDMPRLRQQVDEAMDALGFQRECDREDAAYDAALKRLPDGELHAEKLRTETTFAALDKATAKLKAESLARGLDLATNIATDPSAPAGVRREAAKLVMQGVFIDPPADLPAEAQAAKVETKPVEPETPKAARRTRAAKDESKAAPAPAAEAPAISTGENRVGPQDPPEVQEQDAADEAAETAATRKADATLDDVRAALGDYVTKFGMPAAQEDGPKVLKTLFGDEVSKISAIPDGVANFAKAVDGVREMIAKNPFKRELVG